MLKHLKKLVKSRQIAKIELHDGTTFTGVVTEATSNDFTVQTLDSIYHQNVIEDGQGGVMVESAEVVKEIDFKFTEAVYMTDMVASIQMDVSHKFSVEALKYYMLMLPFLYEDKVTNRKVTPKPEKKLNKKKTVKVPKVVDGSNV